MIRNYWIDDGLPNHSSIPRFLINRDGSSKRSSTTLEGEPALHYIREEKRLDPLLTYFLSKWLLGDDGPKSGEILAFENRLAEEEDLPGKNIYEALEKIVQNYDCLDPIKENGLVVGPTPLGWHRIDEYRMIKFSS